MLIYVTPYLHKDVGFLRSAHIEIEQEIPKHATFLHTELPGHPEPHKVLVEPTDNPKIVRVINNTENMAQLRRGVTFAVFSVVDGDEADAVILDKAKETAEGFDTLEEFEDKVAVFLSSDLVIDESIGVLDITAAILKKLETADIRFVSELRAKTDEELLAIKGIGKASLVTIKKALDNYDAA
jgi:hypothetical protein